MVDIPIGSTGFTIDVFEGSVSDNEGAVSKALFVITFNERVNDIKFTITQDAGHWSALMPTGEYIGLMNPKVLFENRDSAVVIFDMEEKYPSNTNVILARRNENAEYQITEISGDPKPFVPNTIIGSIGFTSNEYGGSTDDQGCVKRLVFNITFPNHVNEIEFEITDDPEDWAALMGDGSYINLINPNVLFQNRDGATIVFQMEKEYPANAPAVLVRRREEAKYTITEIDEEHPFNPVQNIVFPEYIPAGERINLHAQAVVYPMNSTLRGIEWSIVDAGSTGATVSGGWIETNDAGTITLKATIPNGQAIGTDYVQNITLMVINNWITIKEHPHLEAAAICGEIDEFINVIATTPSGDLTYQWYKANNEDNSYGNAISGAESSIYYLPKGLVPGDYFYFCEVRKTNFPSVRTNVARVRVRDKLVSIDIFPDTASIPPGSSQQFGITKNPVTSDELAPVHWFSSDHSIIRVDQKGLATAYNNGTVNLTAMIGNVRKTISVDAVYTPVSSIDFDMPLLLETGTEYPLPTGVLPRNATSRTIEWKILDAGETNASITRNNTLLATAPGTVTLEGRLKNGLNPTEDFAQTFSLSVVLGFTAVTDISISPLGTVREDSIVALSGSVIPSYATNNNITWMVKDPGTTGAKITSGNLLSFTGTGVCKVNAIVENGASKTSNFVKEFQVNVLQKFKSVSGIMGFPEEVQYYDGTVGVTLDAYAVPEDANNREIIYEISPDDESGLTPKLNGNLLTYNSTIMTHEDERSIIIRMTIKDGLSEGVDFVTESSIFVVPPLAPTAFVPVISVDWKMLEQPLRAYRPIRMDVATINPWDATNKFLAWKITREKDIGGSSCLFFILSDENKDDLIANGVLFDEVYDWENYKGNVLYPMSNGEIKVRLEIPDGLAVDEPYTEERTLEMKDPFIAVQDIGNIPDEIYNGTKFYLSPEIDTGFGMDEQTAIWDDRVSSYSNIIMDLIQGTNIATLNNGVITPRGTGNIKVRMTISSGTQEEYQWYDKKFDKIDFTKTFDIRIVSAERRNFYKLVTLKTKGGWFGGQTINIYTEAEYNILRSIGDPDDYIEIGGKQIRRSDITEITFSSRFNFSDMSNFGRNFTSLTKISGIPSCVKNLRNFLMGCTSFNQYIQIPSGVTGDRCLEGFLRDCTSFNKPITIPSGVNGKKCLESFLRGCTSFNQPIRLPEHLEGDCAMYSFLHGCTSFNSSITLPKVIHGIRCMENVLRDCTSFNKTVTMPEEISGKYNIAAFMFNCNAMAHPVIIPTENCALDAKPDVITFSTFYRGTPLANGLSVYGVGAETFCTSTGNQGSETLVPLRTLNANNEGVAPDDDENKFYNLSVNKSVKPNGDYDDFLVADPVEYTIQLINNSTDDIHNVVVLDTLPNEVDFEEATSTKSGFSVEEVEPTPPATEEGEGETIPEGESESESEVATLAETEPEGETVPESETEGEGESGDDGVEEVTKKQIKLIVGTMIPNEMVNITVKCTAAAMAKNIVNLVVATFDEVGQQASTGDNTSSVSINIIDTQPEIPPVYEEEEEPDVPENEGESEGETVPEGETESEPTPPVTENDDTSDTE